MLVISVGYGYNGVYLSVKNVYARSVAAMEELLEDVLRFITKRNKILSLHSVDFEDSDDAKDFTEMLLKVKNQIRQLKEEKFGIDSANNQENYYKSYAEPTLPVDNKHSILKCEFCNQEYEDLQQLNAHVKARHKDTMFPCSICQENFQTTDALKIHFTRHGNTSEPSTKSGLCCQICDTKCDFKYELHIHTLNVHLNNSERRGLNLYEVSSDGRHACPHPGCTKSYTRPYETSRHVLKHKDQSKREYYKSLLGITYTSRNHDRPIINRIDQPDYPFNCTFCPKSFRLNSQCREHIKLKHQGISRYTCPYENCKQGFGLLQQMKKHLSHHDPNGLYKCNYCTLSFDNYRSLQHHITKSHAKH